MAADLLPCPAGVSGASGLREKGWGNGNLKNRLFEVAKMQSPPCRAENTGGPLTPGVTVFLNVFQSFRKLSLSCISHRKYAPRFCVFCFQPLCKNHIVLLDGGDVSEVRFQFIAGQ